MSNEHSALSQFPRIRPCRPEDVEPLMAAAKADKGHGVLAATHVIEKYGEMVGFLSIAGCPSIYTWLHSEKMTARDTLCVVNFYENMLAAMGHHVVAIPVMKDSPLHDYMEKFGYQKHCDTTLFIKEIK